MKFKELFYGMGLKPGAREFSFDVRMLAEIDGRPVEFAQWLHPSAARRPTRVTQAMVDFLRTFIAPGDVAIDVGAHAGDSTLPIALATGPAGLVIALEPNLYAFKVLLANSGLNRTRTNVHPVMAAATPDDGDFVFRYSDAGFCNGGQFENTGRWQHSHFFDLPVRGTNLHRFVANEYADVIDRIRYVKIDTEGADAAVVRTIIPLIKRTRPHIRTEMFKRMEAPERRAQIRLLRDLGYTTHKFGADEASLDAQIGEDDVMKWPTFDVLAVPER